MSEEGHGSRRQNFDDRKRIVQVFEELSVYKKARELTNGIYTVMRRAAVSVVSHIAEGYECGPKQEFVRSLHGARGSCGEIRAQSAARLTRST